MVTLLNPNGDEYAYYARSSQRSVGNWYSGCAISYAPAASTCAQVR